MSDFSRDRWGRPLVTPPDGGKSVAYSRYSSWGSVLEDRFNLELWGKRMVGIGLAQQPHLLAQVAACPIDDAKRLNKLVEEAAKFGGSQTGAGLGTALHEFTARVDAGEMSPDSIIDPWGADVRAYLAALDTHGLEVVRDLVEVQLVHDELRLAGTADRFLRRRDGRLVCADVKTGKSIGETPLAYVVQLAAYAGSSLYDAASGTRSPVGDVDFTVGLLIHLPAGKATCTIHEVDLVAGIELARLAGTVRAAQKRKDLVRVVGVPSPAVVAESKHTERLRWVRDRIVVLRDLGARIDWPADLITPRQALDPDHPDDASADDIERMVAVLDAAERVAQAPFPPEDPATPAEAERDRARRLVDEFLAARANGRAWQTLDVQELLHGSDTMPSIEEAAR